MKMKERCPDCLRMQINKIIGRAERLFPEKVDELKQTLDNVCINNWDVTPSEVSMQFYQHYYAVTGDTDPFSEEKRRSTELALQLLPELRKLVKDSSDPFRTAVLMAAGGNIIDYGVKPNLDLETAKKFILNVLDEQIVDDENIADLKERFFRAKHVFYMLDNCGEAVIDRLVMEQCPCRLTVGVRGLPILNDVTRAELKMSGIPDHDVVDCGLPIPGVLMDRAPEAFQKNIFAADLVISKGQGNYETMDEDALPMYFMLRTKCPVVSEKLGTPLDSLRIVPGGTLI